MNTNCNTNLPFNAVNVTDVTEGMHIRAAFSDERGEVESIMRAGHRRLIRFVGGGTVQANTAGTFRLTEWPEGYNYHAGHGCVQDF